MTALRTKARRFIAEYRRRARERDVRLDWDEKIALLRSIDAPLADAVARVIAGERARNRRAHGRPEAKVLEAAAKARARERRWLRYREVPFICGNCGVQWCSLKPIHGGKRRMYCSNTCRFAVHNRKKARKR